MIQGRRVVLLRLFIAALTRGGPNRRPPPIEMHAHDPLLYSGDMLAWIRQSFESEKQLLCSMFGEDSVLVVTSSEPHEEETCTVLGKIYDAIAQPLQV